MRSTTSLAFLASLAVAGLGSTLAQDAAELPACPTIPLDNVAVLAEPCADPTVACDLEIGCIGAVVRYAGERIDLSLFTEPPPPEYVADCVAPFALSEEVTNMIPQETLGAMRLRRGHETVRDRVQSGERGGSAGAGTLRGRTRTWPFRFGERGKTRERRGSFSPHFREIPESSDC